MLKQLRQQVVHHLWDAYLQNTTQMQEINAELQRKGVARLILDHFAIIDLPGPHSGIPHLKQLFTTLGFVERGKGYLADKQNDFLWMAEEDSLDNLAHEVLPQVVVADFRLEEMPANIKQIIEKYAQQAKPVPDLQTSPEHAKARVLEYLTGRDWPLPTLKEFETVQAFNELLAWVLVFGRRPNHFTLSIHLLDAFSNLTDFLHFVEKDMAFTLNRDGGVIKGGPQTGIAQGSTTGISQTITLADGTIQIPTGFVEFVWRYPHQTASHARWQDFFTGFVAQHADRVIESLYTREN